MMRKLSRIPWQHGAILSIVWAKLPAHKVGSVWQDSENGGYHLARLHCWRLLILRIRETDKHARRLGLPIL